VGLISGIFCKRDIKNHRSIDQLVRKLLDVFGEIMSESAKLSFYKTVKNEFRKRIGISVF